jgi:RNA polymerase sigma-70 factor (ECF subfamily)
MIKPDQSELLDRELISRIRGGDEDAFKGLFRRYAPSARALAQRVVRQPNLAEDIVQEAFLSIWENPDGYDSARGSVRSWLMTTVHHRAVDAVRREEAHRRRADEAAGDTAILVQDPADQVVEEVGLPHERAAILSALDGLPPEQRQVIELMYFDGLTQSKIADRLQLPLGTVKSRTLLGMRRLRTSLVGMER